MSLSTPVQSYQDKEGNSKSRATSTERKEYNEKLMFFVYELVVEAFTKKSKDDLYAKDLNSVNLLLTAQHKADESLRRSFI